MAEPRHCWLRPFDLRGRACSGRMDRAHLIERQTLRREGLGEFIPDRATWVAACRLHHGSFDNFRGVVVPRGAVPEATELFAVRERLLWYLDRRFGRVEDAA